MRAPYTLAPLRVKSEAPIRSRRLAKIRTAGPAAAFRGPQGHVSAADRTFLRILNLLNPGPAFVPGSLPVPAGPARRGLIAPVQARIITHAEPGHENQNNGKDEFLKHRSVMTAAALAVKLPAMAAALYPRADATTGIIGLLYFRVRP